MQQPEELQKSTSHTSLIYIACSIMLVGRGFENRNVKEVSIKRKYNTVEQDIKVSCVTTWYFAIIYQIKLKLLRTKTSPTVGNVFL